MEIQSVSYYAVTREELRNLLLQGAEDPAFANELWYWYLTGEYKDGFPKNYERLKSVNRKVYGILPGYPRCFECNLPLSGRGANIISPLGLRASRFSPQFFASYVPVHK